MNYNEFKNKIRDFPVFSSDNLWVFPGDLQVLRNQITLWCKKGLILKLKKRLYVLNENDRKVNPSRVFIASQLVSPSYISTQYALSYYGLIPERTTDITSVTTKKTSTFKNAFGTFVYQHLKASCLTGFVEQKDENGFSYFIAEPEKALVDYFYLNLGSFPYNDLLIFEESYRFKKNHGLKQKKLNLYAHLFESKKLLKIVDNFCHYIKS